MKSAAHQYEDKLLEFAYGELPQHEADAVDAHVRGCTRCALSLSEIRGVRATMAQLPMESAPDAGLESLLAYATQAAKRGVEAKAEPSLWKRFLTPLVSVMALATVGVIAFRANQDFDTSRATAAAEAKMDERVQKQLAQAERMPAVAPPADLQEKAPAPIVAGSEREQQGSKIALEDLAEASGKRGEVWAPKPASPPQSVTRRANKTKSAPKEEEYRQDYSNAALRGALAKDSAAPPPPANAPAQDKVGFGLGSGLLGDSSGGRSSAPVAKAAPLAEPVKEEAKKRAKSEEMPVAQVVAPVPMPSTAVQKPSKSSYSLKPMGSVSGTNESDDAALERTDSLATDRDAKYSDRQRSELRTKSLESARVASNRGDRLSEIQLLAQVLQNGATGYERVEALKRLCDAYEALGEFDRADPFCDQLVSEFPATVAAKVVEERRQRVQRAPAPKSAAPTGVERERKAVDEASSPRPAEKAPAAY